MTGAAFRLSLRKEVRALLPIWAGCMIGVLAAAEWGRDAMRGFGMLLYVFGSFTLGAQAIGHEYSNRTVGLLLSQPIDRRWLLLVKVVVLVPMLTLLGVVAVTPLLPRVYAAAYGLPIALSIGLLVLLSSICLAPTLTLISRSAIAGVVFTLGIAGAIQGGSELAGYGRTALLWYWYTMLMVCALGALVGWRQFVRLEAIDPGGRDLHLPTFKEAPATQSVAAPARRPIARLIAKEFRLQQLTFAVTAMALLSIAALVARRSFGLDSTAALVFPITVLYAGWLPLLIGAQASAQERQLGTLQWQQLMPVPARVQFVVKSAVAMLLALILSLGLPAFSMWLLGTDAAYREWFIAAFAIVMMTSASLYVSSLNSSSIRAIMMAMPSLLVSAIAIRWVSDTISMWLTGLYISWPAWRHYLGWLFGSSRYDSVVLTFAVLAFAVMLLYFAHQNHWSAERPRTQLRRQAGWIAGAIIAILVGMTLTPLRYPL